MKGSRMPNSSFPDDTTRVQPRQMEDLQPKPAPQTPPPSAVDAIPEEEAAVRQEEARTVRYAIGKLNDFIQWFVTVLEVLLAIRFLLKLIGADPNNLFAGFLYALTTIVLVPFESIVHTPSDRFEWSTLIAMAIYWLLFWAVRRFLRILISSPEEVPS